MMDEEFGKDLLQRSTDALEHGLAMMRTRREAMRESTAFYRGLHWVPERSIQEHSPISDSYDDRERTETYNAVRPIVGAFAASMFRSGPNFRVDPSSTTTEARLQAAMSDAMIRSAFRTGVIDPKELYDACVDAATKGLAWLRVRWNPQGGRFRDDPVLDEQGNPVADKLGQARLDRSFEGEVEVQFHTALMVVPDPARRWKDSRWVHLVTSEPRSKLEKWFPEDIYGKSTEGRFKARDSIVGQELNIDDEGVGQDTDQDCEWIEWWVKPGVDPEFPRGFFMATSGDMIVVADHLPFRRFAWVPIYGPCPVPNSMFSDGLVEDLKGPQGALNLAWSKQTELWDAYSWGILNPKGAIDPSQFQDLPGSVIDFDPVADGAPSSWEAPKPPPELSSHIDMIRAAIDDVATQTNVSRGQNDPNIKSAKQARTLYAFQAGAHAPLFVMWDQAMAELARIVLSVQFDYYEAGRTMQLCGQDGHTYAGVFDPENFDPDVHIVVDPYSDRPVTRSERIQEASDILAAGGFDDGPGPERFRQAVQMDADGVGPLEDAMRQRALEKVIKVSRGVYMPAQPWEPHEQILKELNLFRNSGEFGHLDAQGQQNVTMVADEHEEYLRAQFDEQAAAEGAMQQAQKGRPSAPKPPGPDDAGGRPAEGPVADLLEQAEV